MDLLAHGVLIAKIVLELAVRDEELASENQVVRRSIPDVVQEPFVRISGCASIMPAELPTVCGPSSDEVQALEQDSEVSRTIGSLVP